jgi:hypothetical protein
MNASVPCVPPNVIKEYMSLPICQLWKLAMYSSIYMEWWSLFNISTAASMFQRSASLDIHKGWEICLLAKFPLLQLLCIHLSIGYTCKGVSKSFCGDCLEWELQMVQLSATRCSSIAILWVSLVSFATITHCIALNECLLLLISLSTQSGNFWIHPCTPNMPHEWQLLGHHFRENPLHLLTWH